MTSVSADSVEAAAEAVIEQPTHFVDAVSALADSRDVRADRDIVSSSGIKLVARGTRIDANLRQKLAGHRLADTTLEKTLAVAGGITPQSLAEEAARLIDASSWLQRLATRSDDAAAMRHGFARLALPREILFRLTVAREQRPALFRHSLGVALVSHYVALRSELQQHEVDIALTASLCHDLGELYTDPAILAPEHRCTDEERRYVYVHPITGWLIVRDVPEIDTAVATAVLQHHERLDGSGYPHGRRGEQIGMPARIIGVADVCESLMARYADHRRLSVLLRLNQQRFDRHVVALVHEALAPNETAKAFEREPLAKRLVAFAAVLEQWARLRSDTAIAQVPAAAFLSERMFNLRSMMIGFGFDADSFELPLKLAEEDPTIANELSAVVDEVQYQLADLGREFDRRSAELIGTLDASSVGPLLEWRRRLGDWSGAR
jgi:HD-GYP domain-containing protein (c-di-GMP phosphodiesterase class II)